jgi:hypothetical protein
MQRDYVANGMTRRRRCEAIAAKARFLGFDVSWERVNRQFTIWRRWDEGGLATGYLIRQTGIRKMSEKG